MQTFLYWFAKAIVRGIQALPLEFVARLGSFAGRIAYVMDARHRDVAHENLRRAFPEKSSAEIKAILREHFRRLGENYACAIKTAGMDRGEVLKRCEVVGIEKLKTAPDKNRIVAIGHFGNFEIYPLIATCLPNYEGAATYRALKQPAMNRLMEELRNESGCHFFERRTGLRDLMRALTRNNLVLGLLSDQHGGRRGVWAPFFGQQCSTTPAAAVLALRYDAPLNSAICYRVGIARWRIEIGDEIRLRDNGQPRAIEAIVADVNAALEAAIRRDPANWFWVHKRWKPRGKPKAANERFSQEDV
jgi:Kdo2-lipid IVA lauroyltransferase/acyltransferase